MGGEGGGEGRGGRGVEGWRRGDGGGGGVDPGVYCHVVVGPPDHKTTHGIFRAMFFFFTKIHLRYSVCKKSKDHHSSLLI